MKKVKFLLVLLAMFSLTSFVFAGTPMVVENAAGESVELPVSFGGLFAMVLFTSLVFGATIVFHDNINNYLGNIKLGERSRETSAPPRASAVLCERTSLLNIPPSPTTAKATM